MKCQDWVILAYAIGFVLGMIGFALGILVSFGFRQIAGLIRWWFFE